MLSKHPLLLSLLLLPLPACVTTGGTEPSPAAAEKAPDAAAAKPATKAVPSNDKATNAAAKKAADAKNPDQTPDDEIEAIKSDSLYVDPTPALGAGKDDFGDIDQRAAAYQKDAAVESEDARIERELRELKEADAKAQAEAEKREADERQQARKRDHDAQVQSESPQEQQEALKKAQATPGIDKGELQWRGLED